MRGVGGVGPLGGRHERQVSVDSGSAELDWSSEDGGGGSPTRPAFVTVVSVGSTVAAPALTSNLTDAEHEGESFVTVLSIGAGAHVKEVPDAGEVTAETEARDKQVTVLQESHATGSSDQVAVQDRGEEERKKQVVHDAVEPVQKVPIENQIPVSDVQKILVPTAEQVTVPSRQKVSVHNVQQVSVPAELKLSVPANDGEQATSRKSSRADSSDDEDGDDERDETEDAGDVEDVVVYRLPGERLGFGLRFEGGAAAHEPVRRLLVQSLAVDSPAGRATCAWGRLAPGDQLLRVDGVRVRTLTRLDCVRRLKEARVVVTLRVRRGARCADPPQVIGLELKPPTAPNATAQAPPVPPRKLRAQPPPLPAECYLDVVGLEERAGAQESESDDTGSSLSTALERRSTANSSFSDALPPDPGRALERLEREIAASLDALLPPAEFKDNAPPDLPPRASPPPRERFRSGKRRAPPPPPPAFVEIDLRREADAERADVEWADAERVVTEAAERLPLAAPPTASRRQSVPEPRKAVATSVKAVADVDVTAVADDSPISGQAVDAASDSEEDEPISLDYSVLEELAVPPSTGVHDGDDDAPCWPEDSEFRVTAVSTLGDVLFPSGWGAALPTILEEDAVVGVARTDSKPRLVVQPAEDVPVVEKSPAEKTPVERVPVERVPVERVQPAVAQVAEDGGASLAKEAAMEPPPPPFSRLPPDGHEFPARYEEDGFRFKPEPKPRRGQAEGTKTAPEVPARPSLDEPGTFRCKAEIELQVEAVNIVPSDAEEFKTVPCREEDFRTNKEDESKTKPNKTEDFTTMSSKAEKLVTTPSKVEEFKPVPNKEEVFRQNTAEEFIKTTTTSKDFRPVVSNAENYRKLPTNKAENFRTSVNSIEDLKMKRADIFKPVPKSSEEFLPSKVEDCRTMPSKPETLVPMTSKTTDEFRSSKIDDYRLLPSKPADGLRHSQLEERAASKPRAASWRSDERSDQSVRDKIAMFGRPSEAIESATLPRRLNAQRPEAQEPRAVTSSTLPRKPTLRLGLDDAVILRREQPEGTGLHARSHSLLDLSQRPLDDLRRTSLAALVEQRRRGMSKLRGLVIPERSEAAPPAPGALDLPEIHSREEETLQPWSRGRSASLAAAPISKPAGYGTLPALPKTSPPLPRTLPPFVRPPNSAPYTRAKDTFAFSPKQESPESMPILKTQESWTSFAKPNGPPVASKPNGHHSVASKANGASTVKTVSNGLASISVKPGGLPPLVGNPKGPSPVTLRSNGASETSTLAVQTPAPATYVSFHRPQASFVSTLRPTVGVEVKSDMPPPLPPSLPPSKDDLDGLPRDSGHSSASRTSSVDSSGGRVLAPRSLEAMNRKSVLSSARHSSGRDLKIGSPQIQRKFSDSEDSDNDADDDSDSNSDDNEGDFCDEGAVECDDLVFFSGRDKPDFPSAPVPQPVRVAYVTQVTDVLPELVHVNDGTRHRRLLVSGHPRTELQTKAKVSLNDALKELIAPREVAVKVQAEQPKEYNQQELKEPAPREEARKESVESVPKELASKAMVEQIPKKQALKAAVVATPKEPALKATIDDTVKKQLPKVSVDKTAMEHISKTPKQKASKTANEKISNGHTQILPKEQTNKGRTHSKDRVPNNPPLKPPRDATPKDPVAAERPTPASSRDRRCVSVSEIRTAFQKAERMAHARGASTDSDASPDAEASPDASAASAGATLEVVLRRPAPDAGLGLALAGGADLEAKHVTVHKVLQGGAAARDGRLRRGDHVLSINGKATRGLTHAQSVAALKEPRMEVTLTVSRCEPSDSEPSAAEPKSAEAVAGVAAGAAAGEVTVTLVKETVGLGFSLDGGRDSPHGDVPLTVKKLFLGGVAERSGLVHEGDRVLRIGAHDTAHMSRLEAWRAMKRLPEGPVVLTIGSARP